MPTLNHAIPSSEGASEPRRSPEKWLALIGFVVVTLAGVILISFPK